MDEECKLKFLGRYTLHEKALLNTPPSVFPVTEKKVSTKDLLKSLSEDFEKVDQFCSRTV